MKYDDANDVIKSMAEVKMVMNSHKGAIEDKTPEALVGLLRQEVEELGEAVEEGNLLHIIEEAADVHNFLVALIQQQIDKYRTRKHEINRPDEPVGRVAVEHRPRK